MIYLEASRKFLEICGVLYQNFKTKFALASIESLHWGNSGQAARPAPMEQQAPETARAEAVPTFGMPSSSSSAPLFGAQAPVPAPGLFSSVRVSTLFKPAEGPSGPKPGWGG